MIVQQAEGSTTDCYVEAYRGMMLYIISLLEIMFFPE